LTGVNVFSVAYFWKGRGAQVQGSVVVAKRKLDGTRRRDAAGVVQD